MCFYQSAISLNDDDDDYRQFIILYTALLFFHDNAQLFGIWGCISSLIYFMQRGVILPWAEQ